MTIKQALTGLMHLFIVVFFLGLGLFFFALFFIPEISVWLIRVLQNDLPSFGMIGLFCVGFSWLLGTVFFAMGKGRTLFLRMNTSIDASVVKQTLETVFSKQFSGQIALHDVQIFRGKKLTIGLRFVAGDANEREAKLLDVERHVKKLLIERFGYSKPFFVQVS